MATNLNNEYVQQEYNDWQIDSVISLLCDEMACSSLRPVHPLTTEKMCVTNRDLPVWEERTQ